MDWLDPQLRGFRWLRVVNTAFLLLAACRALVPGLCATLAAANEGGARHASCCTVENAPSKDDDEAPRLHAPAPAPGPCAFCALMHGMVDPLDAVRLATPPQLVFSVPGYFAWAPHSPTPRLHQGRAPPEFA